MYEKTIETIKSYDEAVKAAHEKYNNLFEEMKQNLTGDLLVQRQTIAYQRLQDTLKAELEEAENVMNSEFKPLYDKLNEYITKHPSLDLAPCIEAIKLSGESLSEFEAKSIAESYRNDYLSSKAVVNVLHGMKKVEDINIIKAEWIKDKLDEHYNGVLDYFKGYDPTRYQTFLYTLDSSNPLLNDTDLGLMEYFFTGDFIVPADKKEATYYG